MRRLRVALRALLALALVGAFAATLPRALCGRAAPALFAGEQEVQDALARTLALSGCAADAAAFHTGNERFDGEWALVTQQMTMLAIGQVVLAHPDRRIAYLPLLDRCAERLVNPQTTDFGTNAWREQGIRRLESDNGHAYLGYVNLALGMLRLIHPQTRFASFHDRLTESLARRLKAALAGLPAGMIETYPGEAYPADVAMVAGSIGLHDQATAADHRTLLRSFARSFREHAVDARSGLVFQRIQALTGHPVAPPRASGSALSVYALSFADPALSRELFTSIERHQREAWLGFGGIREYADGHEGHGDIDSGPVLLGVSVSATGFALAGARLHGKRDLFTELYRTADLFGVPLDDAIGRRFLSGGPLGNAILLAMMTATWERGAK